MFTLWNLTDNDCYQHMRRNGQKYIMIQFVKLQTTIEDRTNGAHEYVICYTSLDLNNVSDEEIISTLATYGYTIISLLETYGECMDEIIAECIMEEKILHNGTIIDAANDEKEARHIIKNFIAETYEHETQHVTKEFVDKIIATPDRYDKYGGSIGLYWYEEDGRYIACDNSTSNCWIEEFDNWADCIMWLVDEVEREEE